jgi:integrase
VGNRYSYLHQRHGIFYFFWRNDAGKRIEESLRTRDIKVAAERYTERMNEIAADRSPNDQIDWTLQTAVAHWLDHRRVHVAKGSLDSEKSIVGNLVRGLGAFTRLRALADISRVRQYQDDRLKSGVSAKTVNNEIQVLGGILRLAKLWHRVVSKYKRLPVPKSDIPDALTQDESEKLLRVASASDPYAVAPYAAVLAFSTGMRSGEIKGLKVGDLHHEENYQYLTVRRVNTKTNAGARRVALDTIAVWSLRKLVSRAFTLGSIRPEDYLLPTDRARHTRSTDPLNGVCGYDPQHPQSSWESEWRTFRKASGIEHRRFHDLRHSYITRAAEAGVPSAVIEAQVGHLSAEMIRWYTHISERAQFKAAREMERKNPELLECLGLPRQDSSSLHDGTSNRTSTPESGYRA